MSQSNSQPSLSYCNSSFILKYIQKPPVLASSQPTQVSSNNNNNLQFTNAIRELEFTIQQSVDAINQSIESIQTHKNIPNAVSHNDSMSENALEDMKSLLKEFNSLFDSKMEIFNNRLNLIVEVSNRIIQVFSKTVDIHSFLAK